MDETAGSFVYEIGNSYIFFHQGRNTSPVKMSFQGLWISIEKNVQTAMHMKKYVEKQNTKLLKALKNQGFLAL